MHSFRESGNDERCPFCNSDQGNKTAEENIENITKRVEAQDASAIYALASSYYQGLNGIQQDHMKAIELWSRAGELGSSKARSDLGGMYHLRGDLKKAKFHPTPASRSNFPHHLLCTRCGCWMRGRKIDSSKDSIPKKEGSVR